MCVRVGRGFVVSISMRSSTYVGSKPFGDGASSFTSKRQNRADSSTIMVRNWSPTVPYTHVSNQFVRSSLARKRPEYVRTMMNELRNNIRLRLGMNL
uniref:Secreted protein n=1 Tax=Angiostrongylus cantonensis TaxID=6313 RepID=A0A0K0D665_ANGCA